MEARDLGKEAVLLMRRMKVFWTKTLKDLRDGGALKMLQDENKQTRRRDGGEPLGCRADVEDVVEGHQGSMKLECSVVP